MTLRRNDHRRSRPVRTDILLALLLTVSACRSVPPQVHLPPPYTAYRSPHLTESPPRRVLLMPPVAPPPLMQSANIWNEQLANELRSIHKFEVVRANPALAPVAHCLANLQRGEYSETALIELRNLLRVDGILFVSFHDCHVYSPPRIAASVHLVETTNGETIASLDGNWDARDEATRMQANEYAKRVSTARDLASPNMILESPQYFGKYVAADVAHGLCMLWNPGEPTTEEASKTGEGAENCDPAAPAQMLGAESGAGASVEAASDAALQPTTDELLPAPLAHQ